MVRGRPSGPRIPLPASQTERLEEIPSVTISPSLVSTVSCVCCEVALCLTSASASAAGSQCFTWVIRCLVVFTVELCFLGCLDTCLLRC